MATLLGKFFFNNKKIVSQCDDQTPGFIVETLIIQLGQEKFEQLFLEGGSSPINVRKHKKITVASALMATAWKQVSVETNKTLCEPITASCEAKQTPRESNTVSIETKIASH